MSWMKEAQGKTMGDTVNEWLSRQPENDRSLEKSYALKQEKS